MKTTLLSILAFLSLISQAQTLEKDSIYATVYTLVSIGALCEPNQTQTLQSFPGAKILNMYNCWNTSAIPNINILKSHIKILLGIYIAIFWLRIAQQSAL